MLVYCEIRAKGLKGVKEIVSIQGLESLSEVQTQKLTGKKGRRTPCEVGYKGQ